MEARQLQGIDDLLAWSGDKRVELIDGDIVQRPMARFEHCLAQSALSDEVQVLKRRGGPDGWLILTLVGIDLAKNCFHVYGADAQGQPVFSKKLSRAKLSPFVANLAGLHGGDGGVRRCASLGTAVSHLRS